MAKSKSKAPVITAHASKLPYPQDQRGITTAFKREAARAIGRMGGKDENLALFLTTLKVVEEYAVIKLAAQKVVIANSLTAMTEKQEAAAANEVSAAQLKIETRNAAIAVLQKEAAAIAAAAGLDAADA